MKHRNKAHFKIVLDAFCLLLAFFITSEAGAAPTSKNINAIITNSLDNHVPVDVLNVVTVDNPTFRPADIIETTMIANGNGVVISEAQIIREIIIVPYPSATTASACTGRIYVEDHPISMPR